ncbi:hypothetical protein OBBRIDRAFT_791785 [Obba rivulosa]|uniref:Uncharacterized protein n=1 Tax=Obba rivulosa TaxID=1052685 RepID=A0A8E2AVR7_9APHY|nr:hypothetical protein OBBRIDRAFT_791785 [Obba rivulosa]
MTLFTPRLCIHIIASQCIYRLTSMIISHFLIDLRRVADAPLENDAQLDSVVISRGVLDAVCFLRGKHGRAT